MDGSNFVPSRHYPDGGLTGRELLQVGSASRFLQRDLSEQALQQPVEPSFSRVELAAARAEGFDAGHAAGLQEAANSQAAAEASAVGTIAAALTVALTDGRQEAARIADQAAGAAARALVAAMHAVMPDLIGRSALSEADAMLAHVLPGLSRELNVRVDVPREVAGSVAAAIGRLTPENRDNICVASPEDLKAGDVRVCWSAGHARRQPAQVWQAIMELLEPALAAPRLEGCRP